MKKLLALLLCLALAGAAPVAASAASNPPLFRLTVTDAAGREKTIGSAILFLGGQKLLTSVAVDDPDALTAYAPDGEAYQVVFVDDYSYRCVFLYLDREAENVREAVASPVAPAEGRLAGLTAKGRQYAEPAKQVTNASYGGRDAYLVSADEPLLPGAVLLDEDNDVIALVSATWGEAENRYVAVTMDTLLHTYANSIDDWPSAVPVSYENGLVTLDWSESATEESAYVVYVQDLANRYYSYYLMDEGETTWSVYTAPGAEYGVWVRPFSVGDEIDVYLPSMNGVYFETPDEGLFTDYGFTDESCLAWAPVNVLPGLTGELTALEEVTPEALTDPDKALYLQVTNTYDVDEDVELPMVIVLETPEGYRIMSANGYLFSPDYEASDVWHAEITGLFNDYLQYGSGSFAPGEYAVRYAIGGMWAGGFTFTID